MRWKLDFEKQFIPGTARVESWKLFLKTIYPRQCIFRVVKSMCTKPSEIRRAKRAEKSLGMFKIFYSGNPWIQREVRRENPFCGWRVVQWKPESRNNLFLGPPWLKVEIVLETLYVKQSIFRMIVFNPLPWYILVAVIVIYVTHYNSPNQYFPVNFVLFKFNLYFIIFNINDYISQILLNKIIV